MSDNIFEDLIAKVSENTGASRELVEDILNHQWKSVAAQIKTSGSVEISGIGHFKCSPHRLNLALSRAYRIMNSYLSKLPNVSASKATSLQLKISSCQVLIEKLENRINQYESRLERPSSRNLQLQDGQKMD